MVSTHATRQWSTSTTQISTCIDSDTVVLNTESGRYFSLTGVGGTLWTALQQAHTAEELISLVYRRYDVDIDTAARDVYTLLGTLEEAGLVSCS